MGTVLGTALVLIVLGVLIYPFLGRGKVTAGAQSPSARATAERLRMARLVREIEHDRKSGVINDEEYESQIDELRSMVARSLMDATATTQPTGATDELEREIAAARKPQ